jgi:hypothetical protein
MSVVAGLVPATPRMKHSARLSEWPDISAFMHVYE